MFKFFMGKIIFLRILKLFLEDLNFILGDLNFLEILNFLDFSIYEKIAKFNQRKNIFFDKIAKIKILNPKNCKNQP